jgi:hypothetical protein
MRKDELVDGCLRTPRLRAEKLRLSLDKSFSFYACSVSRSLNSLANLFFHYKSYPDFYTPPRQLSLSFDFAREGNYVLDSVRGRYLGRLKVPIRKRRETRQVQAHMRCRVHTRVHPCSSVHRLPLDARQWSKPARTGVVEANVLAVGLKSLRQACDVAT